jgi:G:T-mismatch repair DNA endonuclease (very short patch repair protein)
MDLDAAGWKVLEIWEHELVHADVLVKRIKEAISTCSQASVSIGREKKERAGPIEGIHAHDTFL